ncbi:hypothetical protein AB0912_34375 [Streptomyces sp. NPDC007084]|uniref:hypothetical protein n=1 Tax=Streptomyces sp. NPDC007084 TaxID=3154313 RepID=UPI0034522F99
MPGTASSPSGRDGRGGSGDGIDDPTSTTRWIPRGVEIRGTAELLAGEPPQPGFDAALIRIHPAPVLGWGLDPDPYETPNARDVTTGPANTSIAGRH